jgi:3-hydroxyethyl bacteriochlorophyllide a dehydrogenase
METKAVVFEDRKKLALSPVSLTPPGEDDIVVQVRWSGISTGTEKLLWTGDMPPFPGMGYPLVPGYESVGEVIQAAANSNVKTGDMVFVPGANCYQDVKGLFGGAARTLVTKADRVAQIDTSLGELGVLLALAATAHHALTPFGTEACQPDLIVGHGTLGRLIARTALALGCPPPVVWEKDADRMSGGEGYIVCDPEQDKRTDYRTVIDVSGDVELLDTLIGKLAHSGEIVFAGFYKDRPSFGFPPAFMREARFRISAEWHPGDLIAARRLIDSGALNLDGLISHRESADNAVAAYETAFSDQNCLKMVMDWSDIA